MFRKVKSVLPLANYTILVSFAEGTTKKYDIKPLFNKFKVFNRLKEDDLFHAVRVGPGGYAVTWNDDIDLACDELYDHGIAIKSVFDNLMSFADATELWNLNESTLRKAVAYGKLINGIDVCKFGKQWVVDINAMEREYGPQRK